MTIFEKFKKLEEIERRRYSINQNSEAAESGTFEIINTHSGKNAGGVFKIENDTLQISVFESTYSDTYLRKVVLSDLADVTKGETDVKLAIKTLIGSIISTRENPGATSLPVGTKYFSLDSDFIDCKARLLLHSYEVLFDKSDERKCQGVGEPKLYTFFKLTKKK